MTLALLESVSFLIPFISIITLPSYLFFLLPSNCPLCFYNNPLFTCFSSLWFCPTDLPLRPSPPCFLPQHVSAAVLLSLWAVLMQCCMSMAIDFVSSLLRSASIAMPDPLNTAVLVIELVGHEVEKRGKIVA